MKYKKKFMTKFLAFVLIVMMSFSSLVSNAAVEWDNTYLLWGTRVHSAVTAMFKVENSSYGSTTMCGKYIPGYSLKPDFVLDKNGIGVTDIYELKPISYFSGYNLGIAQTQLTNYVNAYNAATGRTVYKGTSWNPAGRIILLNTATGPKSVLLSTNYPISGYSGLVFYETLNHNPQPSYEYSITESTILDQNGKVWTKFAQNQGYVLARSTDNTGAVIFVIGIIVAGVLIIGTGGAAAPAAAALVVGGLALSSVQPPVIYN